MEIEPILKEFGLTDKEIKVYLANLALGTALVQAIAKKAGTYRTYTYEILKSLKEKGIVSYVIKSGKQYFEVAKPEKLLAILKEKEEKIQTILPELNTIYKSAVEKPRIEIYEGKEGLKTILNDMTREGKEILNLSSGKNLFSLLKFEFPNFIRNRVKNKIPARIIAERTKETLRDKAEGEKGFRQMRFLPEGKSFTNATFIYGNKVAILSLEKEVMGILIDNGEIARNYKLVFDLLWEISEE